MIDKITEIRAMEITPYREMNVRGFFIQQHIKTSSSFHPNYQYRISRI